MKKIILFAFSIGIVNLLVAQTAKKTQAGSVYVPSTGFHETMPLADMPLQTEEQMKNAAAHHEMLEERRESMKPKPSSNFKPTHKDERTDPVRQSAMGALALTNPIVNFDGQFDGPSCPNDPNGAVGATQYVQMYNSAYAVYSKTGTLLKGPVDLASIFPNIPNDDGDPVVLYDKFADRWFISEFQISNSPCGFSVAISKTGDATGAYYVFNFMYAGWTPFGNYPDYPKFSIWSDGYYATANLQPSQIMVLDRGRMLAGKASAGMIVASYPFEPTCFSGAFNNSLWNDPKTLDCDASALPPYGTPCFLVFFENVNSGGASNSIVFDKLVHDTTAHTLTITKWDSLTPAAFSDYFNNTSFATIAQPGINSFSGNAVDALDGSFNFRVPFLKFTGYNSVILSNTVNTGNTVAGIRWYEVRQDPSTYHFSIYQQGTYAPADGVNRWNGSIAMDQDGDIAMAYSADDSLSLYPCIRYTGRMVTDALGTMTGTETTAIGGSAPIITCFNRWGDYSDMTLDVDGFTFWHTNQYDKGGNAANRIFSFKLNTTAGVTNLVDLAVFKVYQSNEQLNVIANTLPSNDDVQVDLFDLNGKQLSAQNIKPSANAIQTTIPVNRLAKAVYFVRIGNINYQRVFKVLVK